MDGNWLTKIFSGFIQTPTPQKKTATESTKVQCFGWSTSKTMIQKENVSLHRIFLDTLYTSLSPSGALRHNGLPVGPSPQKEHTYHTMLWGHLNSSTLEFRLPLKIVQHSWTGFHSEKHMVGRIVARPSIQLGWTLGATDTREGGREGLKLATLGFINWRDALLCVIHHKGIYMSPLFTLASGEVLGQVVCQKKNCTKV